MATTASAVASTGARELYRGVELYDPSKVQPVADKLVGGNIVTDTRSFLKIATFTAPGAPQEMDPDGFDSFAEDQYAELDNATFECQQFGLKLRFTRKVWKDNQFPTLMRDYGAVLRRRFRDRREILAQNKHFNDVDTNLAPNGDAYASASIDLDDEAAEVLGVAYQSNILDPAETPSPDMVDRLTQLLMDWRDNKGFVMGFEPPFDVFCTRKWYGTWVQIKKSTETFGTPDHSHNYAASLIRSITVVPYATHDDYTRIQATGDNETKTFIWDREVFDMYPMRYDDNNDSMVVSAVSRLVTDEFHQQGTAFSLAGD